MLKIYHKKIKDKEIKELDNFVIGSWVRVDSPTTEDIAFLKDKLSLDEDLLKDSLDPYEVPRLESEEGRVYIFARIPNREEDGKIVTVPILIIIGPNFVATVCARELKFLNNFVSSETDFSTTQKTKLVLQIFSAINHEYSRFFTEVSRKIRGISVKLESIKNSDIAQFVTFEEVLTNFINSLSPTNSSLKTILSGKILDLYEEDEDLVENLLLGNDQLISTCEVNLKNITNIREAYSTIMTNNLNQSIRLLTIITALVAIPTLVTSFYGMNLRLPFEDFPEAYLYVMGMALAISGGILLVFIKKRWF